MTTSSGDAAPQATDDWTTLDDGYDGDTFQLYYDDPSTAHVQGQPGAPVSLGGLRFEQDSGGYYGGFYARGSCRPGARSACPRTAA